MALPMTKEMLQKEFPEVIVLQGDGKFILDGGHQYGHQESLNARRQNMF